MNGDERPPPPEFESPPGTDPSDFEAFAAKGRPMNGAPNGKLLPFEGGKKRAANIIEWHGGAEVFAPLAATPWISKELQMGPGRPTMLVGYGASAKTLAAQSLILSVATGTLVWGRFPCERGIAKHLDYEQGFKATARRYQRLARGMAIDPRDTYDRFYVSSFPQCYLNSNGALDTYCRACDGASLVVLDALRGALPGEDENDSGVRAFVDVMTQVSEKTGATVLLLHHAGKPKDGHLDDARTAMRGSSALFDAAGCVLLVVNQPDGKPRLVQQIKVPAEAESAAMADFGLEIEDVLDEEGSSTGVRIVCSEVEKRHAVTADERFDKDAAMVIALVRKNSGCTQRFLRALAGMRTQRLGDVLELLVERGQIVALDAARGGKSYHVGEQQHG